MTLLDRYLKAVAAHLPKDMREDIIAELRDLLLNRFEAKEEELGRALTEDEQEAIIREMGHPLTVAGRYRSGPNHLIGPELYPYWLFVVKVGVAAVLAITILGTVIQLTVGEIDAAQVFARIFNGAFNGAVTLIGFATIAGFIIERQPARPKFMTDWRVKDLGLFELGSLDADALERQFRAGAAAGQARGSRRLRSTSPMANAMASAAVMVVVLLWWVGLLPIGDLRPGPGDIVVGGVDYGAILNTIVDVAFWPVLAYLGVRILFDLFRAWRPGAVRRIAAGKIALAAVRLAAAVWIWTVSPLAPIIRVESVSDVIEAARRMFSGGLDLQALLTVAMVFITLETVAVIGRNLWRLLAPRDQALPA
ncbi:MAG: hypothetical protein GC145_08875 [Caulobacter sp.]|nr:hypothetical protein [Caulobacter sp.]